MGKKADSSSMLLLPCNNQPSVIQQIKPTIELLKDLHKNYPQVLRESLIEPDDYHGGLVFRSAIESIRGSYIASSTPGREKFVSDILERMMDMGLIHGFDKLTARERWDFEVYPDQDEDYLSVIEVKGGEGNSVNISERSRKVKEFGVWCHLDGSIQHPPSKGAKAIIGRITNELSARAKQVDMVFFRDVLCGTRARPCPKYGSDSDIISEFTCTDIFLFPQQVPTLDVPEPPVHTLDTLRMPLLILKYFRVDPSDYSKHLWFVNLKLETQKVGGLAKLVRNYNIIHQGQIISSGKGKPFSIANI